MAAVISRTGDTLNFAAPQLCVFGLTHAEHQHLRLSRISFQQHERNHARGVPLVHVVSTPRAGVHDRSETHVVAVDARPQPFALLS